MNWINKSIVRDKPAKKNGYNRTRDCGNLTGNSKSVKILTLYKQIQSTLFADSGMSQDDI